MSLSASSNPNHLTDASELLYRQVHPNWHNGKKYTSLIFTPMPKDTGELSVSRSTKVTAPKDYVNFTVAQGLKSMAVLAVSVGDCQAVDLHAYDDPQPHNSAHALIDFKGLEKKDIETRAKKLMRAAAAYGVLHPPGAPELL